MSNTVSNQDPKFTGVGGSEEEGVDSKMRAGAAQG